MRSPLPASKLDVPVFTTARGMLNREDRDLLCYLVYYMIDKVAEDIAILTIQDPARSREYRDV